MKHSAKHSKMKNKNVSPQGKIQLRMIIIIACITILALAYNGYKIHVQDKDYQAQEQDLDQQIQEQNEVKEELEKQEDYMETDAYKEEFVRKNFNMIKKGEKLLKEKE